MDNLERMVKDYRSICRELGRQIGFTREEVTSEFWLHRVEIPAAIMARGKYETSGNKD